MKAEIKAWLKNQEVFTGEGEMLSPDDTELVRLISDCMGDIAPKLEWTLMSDKEPSGHNDHIECYIVLKRYPKYIEEYPWNTHHKCFDDKDYDDHAYSPEDVLCWIEKPPVELPAPPT